MPALFLHENIRRILKTVYEEICPSFSLTDISICS